VLVLCGGGLAVEELRGIDANGCESLGHGIDLSEHAVVETQGYSYILEARTLDTSENHNGRYNT